ncbi:hypothetical protein [Burkholderia ubonensis]|nr:hypothetical protein [Burkholderia ubonensis]
MLLGWRMKTALLPTMMAGWSVRLARRPGSGEGEGDGDGDGDGEHRT